MSLACRSCRNCQQTRPIFPSSTHRISTKLHKQQHMSLLSSLIISVYILILLVLYKMYRKNHKYSYHGDFNMVQNFFKFLVKFSPKCKIHSFQYSYHNMDCRNFLRWQKVEFYVHIKEGIYVSISFYFDLYFMNYMLNYPTLSREHCGKKLLVITEQILYKIHFKF